LLCTPYLRSNYRDLSDLSIEFLIAFVGIGLAPLRQAAPHTSVCLVAVDQMGPTVGAL
jgi:hypothetical protein